MTNAVTIFDPGASLPAHIASFFGSEEGSNIESRASVPSLSPQGKQWTIALNGEKTTLMRNVDGDMVPVGVLKVVVLDFAKRRGRAYYEGAYDPAKESAPICWSDDGIAPDKSLPDPATPTEPGSPRKQSLKCESCPMAAKGSKIAEGGKAMTACGQHRMLAVVPGHALDFEPLRLKIAITSDWDKQSPDAEAAGWFGFQNYLEWLKSRGVTHTAALVTKMKFDANAAYPKIFFAADRWLSPEELAQVSAIAKDEKVGALLAGTWTPAGVDGVRKDDTTAAVGQPQTAAQVGTAASAQAGNDPAVSGATTTVAAQPAAVTPSPTESPAEKMLREAAALVEAERAAKAAASAPAAAQVDDDGDGEIVMAGLGAPAGQPVQQAAQAGTTVTQTVQPQQAAQAAATTPTPTLAPAVAVTSDPALKSLLDDWGKA